jgi:hypothetical protein
MLYLLGRIEPDADAVEQATVLAVLHGRRSSFL